MVFYKSIAPWIHIVHLPSLGPCGLVTSISCNRESRVVIEPIFYCHPLYPWVCYKWVALVEEKIKQVLDW